MNKNALIGTPVSAGNASHVGSNGRRRTAATQGAMKRLAAASRLPRLPRDHIRIIVRPKDGLDVRKITSARRNVPFAEGNIPRRTEWAKDAFKFLTRATEKTAPKLRHKTQQQPKTGPGGPRRQCSQEGALRYTSWPPTRPFQGALSLQGADPGRVYLGGSVKLKQADLPAKETQVERQQMPPPGEAQARSSIRRASHAEVAGDPMATGSDSKALESME
ncbi:hypothetical protein HPB48_023319 [Haemaphysalis longicornis]|uniref:Uncharacterized protein n=1 Tax=Haemaphysalis longicornis TaxID=44386 RepID=A0A9J6H793_HAELO|nr:hypothetical protein HPB48_023319 [Haemaphysalis longicornis]